MLFAIWANVHGSFLLGVVILAIELAWSLSGPLARHLPLFTELACASTFVVSPVPALASASVAPVRIKSLTIARHVLPAAGGATVLRLQAANGATCWVTAPAAVHVNRAYRSCAHVTMATVVRLSPIGSQRAAHFRIYAWVQGRDGRTLERAALLAERGLAPARASFSAAAPPALDKAYSHHLSGTGRRSLDTWRVVGGPLPPGLTLSAAGVISGTPSAAGTFEASVQVSDSSNPPASTTADITLAVAASLAIATASMPETVTTSPPYTSFTFQAAGGTAPCTWSWVASGTSGLPPGMSLSSRGVLSGTPTKSGTYARSSVRRRIRSASGSPMPAGCVTRLGEVRHRDLGSARYCNRVQVSAGWDNPASSSSAAGRLRHRRYPRQRWPAGVFCAAAHGAGDGGVMSEPRELAGYGTLVTGDRSDVVPSPSSITRLVALEAIPGVDPVAHQPGGRVAASEVEAGTTTDLEGGWYRFSVPWCANA